jgi:hypothetical protein
MPRPIVVDNNFQGYPEMDFVKLVEQNQKPNMIVAEIGCYAGDTTMAYIDIVKKNNGKVFVIDTFTGTEFSETEKNRNLVADGQHYVGDWNKNLYKVFLNRFKNYEDMLTVFKGYSDQTINWLPNNCDIIFIDADHKYKNVKNDIELARKKVKPGGILSGHDLDTWEFVNTYEDWELDIEWSTRRYPPHHPGVAQAVYEAFGIVKKIGNVVWYVNL